MAELIWDDAVITYNSVVLSDRGNQVTINMGRESKDRSTFGGGSRISKPGLKTVDVSIKFLQDFAASEVDATIYAAWAAKTEATLSVKMTSAAVSATNPQYSGTMYVETYPVGGSHGEMAETTVGFKLAADDWDRVTS